MKDLAKKYAPVSLADLCGQDEVKTFFSAVLRKLEDAPRYYLLSGPFGVGKTATARAFARDLLGTLEQPHYIEIDSGDSALLANFGYVQDLIFRQVPGYKVVVLDEAHLLPENCQERLLKVVEDFFGPIFIFFATTDPQKMLPPLVSRLHRFNLTLFSDEQCLAHAKSILEREGDTISPNALRIAAMCAGGHMRDMLKQCERILFVGEAEYLKHYQSILVAVEKYYTDFSLGDQASVEGLFQYHVEELKVLFQMFFREQVLNPSGRYHEKPYHVSKHAPILATWLRLYSLIKQPSDFYSMLYVFRASLRKCV